VASNVSMYKWDPVANRVVILSSDEENEVRSTEELKRLQLSPYYDEKNIEHHTEKYDKNKELLFDAFTGSSQFRTHPNETINEVMDKLEEVISSLFKVDQ